MVPVETLFVVAGAVLLILALLIRPVRKAMGLLLVILGTIACLTVMGLAIGIPLIFVGGILLFIGKR